MENFPKSTFSFPISPRSLFLFRLLQTALLSFSLFSVWRGVQQWRKGMRLEQRRLARNANSPSPISDIHERGVSELVMCVEQERQSVIMHSQNVDFVRLSISLVHTMHQRRIILRKPIHHVKRIRAALLTIHLLLSVLIRPALRFCVNSGKLSDLKRICYKLPDLLQHHSRNMQRLIFPHRQQLKCPLICTT